MDDSGSTKTYTTLHLGNEIDRELVRITREAEADEAANARRELRARHERTLAAAVEAGCTARTVDQVLDRAIRGFDASRGRGFGDYLRCQVRAAIRRVDGTETAPVATGLRQSRFLQVRVARLELTDELGREPRLDELADRCGFSTAQVLDALAVRSADRVRTRQLAAHLADDEATAARLDIAISELDERTRIVLDRVLRDGRSRRQVARELGISTFDVDDLERRGRAHLDAA